MQSVSTIEGTLYRGSCPMCRGEALAWDHRLRRQDNAWMCVRCGRHGDLFNLHHLARAAA